MLLVFIVVVILGHNLGNSQVSVDRTIGPNLVKDYCRFMALLLLTESIKGYNL